jgi:hypothetical protein
MLHKVAITKAAEPNRSRAKNWETTPMSIATKEIAPATLART